MWHAVTNGQRVKAVPGDPSGAWPINGELCTIADGLSERRPRALRLLGAEVAGDLDLDALKSTCPLSLEECSFAGRVSQTRQPLPTSAFPTM